MQWQEKVPANKVETNADDHFESQASGLK